jgi:hypothetical protein
MRISNPDHICGLCDEFDVDQAAQDQAAQGMGLCQIAERGRPLRHVPCDSIGCVSFRLDRKNLTVRRRHVKMHRPESAD